MKHIISIQSLSDNLIPNAYVKNLSLDSTYKETIINSKNEGYYDPNSLTNKTAVLGDTESANITISMKFAQNANSQSDVMQLLDSELSEYIKIYIHQTTSLSTYEDLSTTTNKNLLIKTPPIDVITKVFSLKDVPTHLPEQLLDDGTILKEIIIQTKFDFPKGVDFLSYIIIPAIEHPDLVGVNGSDDIIIGKVSADIIILNKVFQNKGMIFTIAPFPAGSDTIALSQFGNPGEIWGGSVYRKNNIFMVGGTHTSVPHPILDYQIVPVTKFVDNRVGKKIERNVLNITKSFEQVNSLTSRYKNSALNLLDFQSYRKTSFISDIHLSQDKNMNVNGFVSIDKLNLVRNKSAFPFLLDNIENALDPGSQKDFIDNLLKDATRLQLNVYEENTLLGTITEEDVETQFTPDAASLPGLSMSMAFLEAKFKLKREYIKILKNNQSGLEHFSFKQPKRDASTYTYKVEVKYIDPTVEYVKSILPLVTKAQESVEIILKRVQMMKPTISGKFVSGFDPITQKINDNLLKELMATQPVDIQNNGMLLDIIKLVLDGKLYIYFYTPDVKLEEFAKYMQNLSNLNTATLDSLLVLSRFLLKLKNQINANLSSFGVKPLKDSSGTGVENQYGYAKNQGSVDSSRPTRVITESQINEIKIFDYGYDFTGFMDNIDRSDFTEIDSDSYVQGCLDVLYELTTPENAVVTSKLFTIQSKGFGEQQVFDSLYSYLSMPIDKLKKCILLPQTVVDVHSRKINIESIFTSILKLKYLLLVNNVGPGDAGSYKNLYRKDLDLLLGAKFGAFLPKVLLPSLEITPEATSTSTANEDFGIESPIDPTLKGPISNATMPNTGVDPFVSPINPTFYTSEWVDQLNNNFILASLLNKLLVSKNYSLVVPMGKKGFLPVQSMEELVVEFFDADKKFIPPPLQVQALSPSNPNNLGPFKDFQNGNQIYINKNIINPLLLCYYWFVHQNIAKIEFLSGYEESTDTVYLKNEENPYEINKSKEIIRTSVKKPVWKVVNPDVLDGLLTGEKLLCRITRYEYPYYINKNLIKALNLPLINNYFMLEGS